MNVQPTTAQRLDAERRERKARERNDREARRKWLFELAQLDGMWAIPARKD